MPDVLNVPSGPGKHRPHRDYEDTRAYCAACYEAWPCEAHLSGYDPSPPPERDLGVMTPIAQEFFTSFDPAEEDPVSTPHGPSDRLTLDPAVRDLLAAIADTLEADPRNRFHVRSACKALLLQAEVGTPDLAWAVEYLRERTVREGATP